MQKVTHFLLIAISIALFNSCQKELSCEDCLNTNQPPTNHPPVANAGNDTMAIVLPGNTVNLNGSLSFDPDSNITGYLWTKISVSLPHLIFTDANASTNTGN